MWAIAVSSFVFGTGFGVLAAIGGYVMLRWLLKDEDDVPRQDIHHGVPIRGARSDQWR
jgi:hypothetical protein